MVRVKNKMPETRTEYYFKPGQNPENTKVSERGLALICSKSAFQRFHDYTEENKKAELLAEREVKRLEALKKATYEMSKTWEDTVENIAKRRKDDLLSRRKKEEDERAKFAKELAAKTAMERAEIVKQAKELLFWRNPRCRMINKALLVSECYRELDAQVKFQNSIKGVDKKLDTEYAKHVLGDVEKYYKEEKKKSEERKKRHDKYIEELEKQIRINKRNMKNLQESIRKSETEDIENMAKEIEEIKKKELQEQLEKKELLKKMFLENIEEKKKNELKMQEEEEYREKNLQLYRQIKQEMEKATKETIKNNRDNKIEKSERLARVIAGKIKKGYFIIKRERDIDEIVKEREQEQEEEYLKKVAELKEKKEKAHRQLQEDLKALEEEKEKRDKEEADMKLWDTLQRYKKDEFNKKLEQEQREKEKDKKLTYSFQLKKQMAEKDAERYLIRLDEDDAADIKEMWNRANEKVLTYGEKVLQESRGVRPTFPIEKAIREFKKDVGLVPRSRYRQDTECTSKISKRKRGKRPVCNRPVKEGEEFLLG